MKKKFIACVVMALILASLSLDSFAQVNPRGGSSAQIGGGKVTIDYGRPSLRGRDLDTMIAPGKYWRLGADDPTTLTTDVDLVFGNKTIPKGKYVLMAKLVEKGKWNLAFLTKGNAFKFDPADILAEIPLRVSELKSPVETLTIDLSGKGKDGKLSISWGTLQAWTELQAGKKS